MSWNAGSVWVGVDSQDLYVEGYILNELRLKEVIVDELKTRHSLMMIVSRVFIDSCGLDVCGHLGDFLGLLRFEEHYNIISV